MTGNVIDVKSGFDREVFPLVFASRLGKAIVCQAIYDVLEARRKMPTASRRKKLEYEKKVKKCEDFFMSPLCDLYCDRENAGTRIVQVIEENPGYLRDLVKRVLEE